MDLIDVEPPTKSWFADIENRLYDLENNGSNNIDFETIPIDFSSEWEIVETTQDIKQAEEELVDV